MRDQTEVSEEQRKRTRIAQTSPISKIVGTTLKSKDDKTREIPLEKNFKAKSNITERERRSID
jgi:hypothetical protein